MLIFQRLRPAKPSTEASGIGCSEVTSPIVIETCTALDWGASAPAVSIRVRDDARSSELQRLLHDAGSIDIEAADGQARVEGQTAPATASAAAAEPVTTAGSTERIPVAKEELSVGKRQTEQRYRVRVYPVSREVSESVNLRDERVVIERRPTDATAVKDADFESREFEVVERHEDPVVSKKVRADEEVVVHKDVNDRTETVRDTVKETQVDVERPQGGATRADTRTTENSR
jgi:stress response protein YsnF